MQAIVRCPVHSLLLALALGMGCGAPARSERQPTPAESSATPRRDPQLPVAAPLACPGEEGVLAGLSELERRARQSLEMPCTEVPGGRWELVVRELASSPLSEEEDGSAGERIAGRFALSFVSSSGRLVGAARPFEFLEGEGSYRATRVHVRGHFDFDGDGLHELLVWVGVHEYEATPRGAVVVMTVRGGAVTEYLPAGSTAPIDDVDDVDADGRPDLISCTPYCGTSPWGASPVPAGGPHNVFRSLPGGTFSNQDPIALERLRAACPTAPARFLADRPSEEGYETALTAVSCARIHGVSTEEIARRIAEEVATGGCTDEGWADCAHLAEALVQHGRLTPAHHLP